MPRPPLLSEANYARIRQRVLQACGLYLQDDRLAVVATCLYPRLKLHRFTDFDTYLALLDRDTDENEARQLLHLLLPGDGYFFREHRHFELLAPWLADLDHPARLWSAACASGEEAWSLAMVAAERACNSHWQVLGSDVSPARLELARAGLYDIRQARYFPEGWFERHCLRGIGEMAGQLRIAPALHEHVRFAPINLIHPLPEDLGQFDAILLRNLLTGMAPAYKNVVLRRLLTHLRPGGLLMISHSESIHELNLPLRPVLPSVFEHLC